MVCPHDCAKAVQCAPLYKACCRNSDQIVCIEACAKMCHTCCIALEMNQCSVEMLSCLRDMCTWCNNCCERLHIGTHRDCCVQFHSACERIIISCGEQSYRGKKSMLTDQCIERLSMACSNLYQTGIVEKTKRMMMRDENIATCELCMSMCSALLFMCCNACENVDTRILKCFADVCSNCVSCGFCVQEATECVRCCTEELESLQQGNTTGQMYVLDVSSGSDLAKKLLQAQTYFNTMR